MVFGASKLATLLDKKVNKSAWITMPKILGVVKTTEMPSELCRVLRKTEFTLEMAEGSGDRYAHRYSPVVDNL